MMGFSYLIEEAVSWNKSAPWQRGLLKNGASPRIVGGSDVQSSRFPYAQISLQYDGEHYCGGSLVASDMVLTAAHCSGSFDSVQFSVFNLAEQSENVEMHEEVETFSHPLHDAIKLRYDVLIVKLDGLVEMIEPARINRDSEIPEVGEELTVIGWGLTNATNDDSYPDILQRAQLNYIPYATCKAIADENGVSLDDLIYPDMLCAAHKGRDACYGDSGSPLVIEGDRPDEDVQVGVVSWGIGCADVWPGVYSRLSYSFDWIRQVVCSNSAHPPDYFGCSSAAPSSTRITSAPSPIVSSSPSQFPSKLTTSLSPSRTSSQDKLDPNDLVISVILRQLREGVNLTASLEEMGLFEPNHRVIEDDLREYKQDSKLVLMQNFSVSRNHVYRLSLGCNDLFCHSGAYAYEVSMTSSSGSSHRSMVASGQADSLQVRRHTFLALSPTEELQSTKYQKNLSLVIKFGENPTSFCWVVIGQGRVQDEKDSYEISSFGPSISYGLENRFSAVIEKVSIAMDGTDSPQLFTLIVHDVGRSNASGDLTSYMLLDGQHESGKILIQSTASHRDQTYYSFIIYGIDDNDRIEKPSFNSHPAESASMMLTTSTLAYKVSICLILVGVIIYV